MATCRLNFIGGPWHGEIRDEPTVVPSELIPVFADADSDVVCADEQVIVRLGGYRKKGVSIMGGEYWYHWEER